jgi:hypothetical protein
LSTALSARKDLIFSISRKKIIVGVVPDIWHVLIDFRLFSQLSIMWWEVVRLFGCSNSTFTKHLWWQPYFRFFTVKNYIILNGFSYFVHCQNVSKYTPYVRVHDDNW